MTEMRSAAQEAAEDIFFGQIVIIWARWFVIITGGMGMHAQQLFTQYGVKVVLGAESGDPKSIVESWLNGDLVSGSNACDH